MLRQKIKRRIFFYRQSLRKWEIFVPLVGQGPWSLKRDAPNVMLVDILSVNMDKKTTLEDIKNWARKVRDERGWHPDARSLAISIVLEAGELMEHFQWQESPVAEEEIEKSKAKKDDLEKEV